MAIVQSRRYRVEINIVNVHEIKKTLEWRGMTVTPRSTDGEHAVFLEGTAQAITSWAFENGYMHVRFVAMPGVGEVL